MAFFSADVPSRHIGHSQPASTSAPLTPTLVRVPQHGDDALDTNGTRLALNATTKVRSIYK